MTPGAVEDAARAAGRYLLGPPARVALDLPADRSGLRVDRGIYLVYARDGELHYIGKTDRPTGTAAGRLNEHLRSSRRKRAAWRTLWIVPLTADMPAHMVMTLERALIRAYRPVGNLQHAMAA